MKRLDSSRLDEVLKCSELLDVAVIFKLVFGVATVDEVDMLDELLNRGVLGPVLELLENPAEALRKCEDEFNAWLAVMEGDTAKINKTKSICLC